MESDTLKSSDLDKISGLLTGSVASELRRLELERASWLSAMTQSQSLAEQMQKLVGDTSLAAQMSKQARELQVYSLAERLSRLIPENSPALQMAKQWQEQQRTEQESIRRMLEPLQDIRSSLLKDSAIQRMLEDLAKPLAASEQFAKLIEQATGSSAVLKARLGTRPNGSRQVWLGCSIRADSRRCSTGSPRATWTTLARWT